MNLLIHLDVISGFIQILLCVALFAPPIVWSHQAGAAVIGISIDNLDQFVIAISDVDILSRGYFEVREPFPVNVVLSESLVPRPKPGRFWSALATEGQSTLNVVESVLAALKTASETAGSHLPLFRVCAMTSPLALSTRQKERVSLALKETFGCTDDTLIIRETQAITSALNIESDNVENSPIAVVAPDEYTYIIGEDSSTVVVIDTFPPPLNLDLVFAKHNVWEVVVVQSSEKPRFGPVYGEGRVPIRYERNDIIARGATIIATLALPEEPVSILPLPLGIVLHGSLFHIVIPPFSVLPKQAKITLTTVHDNQETAVIEVREGSRARAAEDLLVTRLRVDDIPPAPAGTVLIEATLTVEHNNRITIEAIEALSETKVMKVVERDQLVYPEGVLEDQQAAGEKYKKEDAQFIMDMDRIISRQGQPSDAVQLFTNSPFEHEEL
ncbi:unnamed protein product [Rhizoctonia solani]|uniref:Uncharacterized protein n=1 Tax=Rhizoctonia solani TaxID=456999 RepID=A0A8H3DVV7_9AGAM|nr:unnamed protein product [Rhizoctonia solani]CAE7080937.1 unnamed protein product [Rhizoctonia solani]